MVMSGKPKNPLSEQSESAEMPAYEPNGPDPDEKKRPVMKFQYPVDKGTNVLIAVWDKVLKLQDGREFTVYSCTIQCTYFDTKTGEWVQTPFLRGAALPIVAHGLQRAFDWIIQARNEARDYHRSNDVPF